MSVPHVVTIPVGKLRPNKRNARTHSKRQIRQIANSILRFGWTYPILSMKTLRSSRVLADRRLPSISACKMCR